MASPNDADGVTRLLQASYPVLMRDAYAPEILDAALPLMTVAQPSLLESGTYYVAESPQGEIVACGGWTRERPDTSIVEEGVGHVRHFGVHPDWTRQGVGRALCRRCMEDASNAGLRQLECYASLNGERFYASLGFRRLGEITTDMAGVVDFPNIHMVADI